MYNGTRLKRAEANRRFRGSIPVRIGSGLPISPGDLGRKDAFEVLDFEREETKLTTVSLREQGPEGETLSVLPG